ncbi:uncharacterized protein C7orf57-like isoform X1 [Acipenser ruthenus]|uniref:uncharacterized protein C7orf57-like isoform X1 n=1 Tax=Acipenser ruthenus TaxID=7906 RepID=UPI0027415709|nr:uncharacterized protein C7orf57-like isoform X1 [Acipenser ruthenus]
MDKMDKMDSGAQVEKNGIKSVNDSSVRPSSQIPGLGNCTDTGDEKRAHGRRTGVVETDSDYVKLAKQGGQQGLLRHEVNLQSKPNLDYTAPDWFSFESNSQEHQSTQKRTIPDFMTSEEFQRSPTKGSFQPLDAPFGTDNKTTWEREGDNFTADKDKNTTMVQPVSQMENLSLTSENHHLASKFKKTSSQKSDKPVSMQKLLSFGYADDWHEEHDKTIPKETPNALLSIKDSTLTGSKLEMNHANKVSLHRGSTRQTGLRGLMSNKVAVESSDTHFNIFGYRRYRGRSTELEQYI